MRTRQKIGILAASFVASLAMAASLTPAKGVLAVENSISIPKGFSDPVSIDISASNEALNHWQYYISNTLDDDGNNRGDSVYEDKNVHFKATENGRTGKAMWIEKKTQDGVLTAYSYAFDVLPNQNYAISAYVKNVCEKDPKNATSFMVKELDSNGVKTPTNDEFGVVAAVSGATTDWQKVQFSFKTSATGNKLILKVEFKGKGDFYLDDIAIQTCTTALNTVSYKLFGIGKLSDGATDELSNADAPEKLALKGMASLTSANISSDSSDGDGASLLINDGEIFKTNFSALSPNKTYRLSFKYKHLAIGSENRLSVRINYTKLEYTSIDDKSGYYFDPPASEPNVWSPFSADFKGSGDNGTLGLAITAYANYLIDELSLVSLDESDPMQFIANGSFSGAYTEGYYMGSANSNIAKQADGTSVFILGNGTHNDKFGERGYVEYSPAGLTAGKEYTLSYDYRFAGANWVNGVLVYLNDAPIQNLVNINYPEGWQKNSYKFTATGNEKFTFYGPSYYFWATYYKNIQVTDSEGNVYNPNTTLVTPEPVFGDNVFPYGTFEGDTAYVPKDWTFQGDGNIYGLVFDTRFEEGVGSDTKPDWMICLNGTEDTPASATSKEIAVNKRTLALSLSMCNGKKSDLGVSALVGETEIESDENGFIELPEGTTSIKLKLTAQKYVAFKKLYLLSHTHITPAAGDIKETVATCTQAGGKTFLCTDCGKTVYLERTSKLDHDLKHEHQDATCQDGYDKYVCSRCHQEFNVTVLKGDPSKHQYEEVILKEPTCIKTGLKQEECKICHKKKDPTVIPATGEHTYKNGVCTVCGAKDPNGNTPGSSQPGSSSPSTPTTPESEDNSTLWVVIGVIGGVVVLGVGGALLVLGLTKKKKVK